MRETATHRLLLLIGVAVCLAACAVGPNYRRPTLDVPAAYRIRPATAAALIDTAWWRQFQDPVLDELIGEALKSNLDARIAAARIEEYSGRLESVRSALFPQLGYGASALREHASNTSNVGSSPVELGTSSLLSLDTAAVSQTLSVDSAALTASWEIDLWGQLRRATEAARADLLATEQARRGTILTLIAQLAGGYVTLRSLDRELEIARNTLAARKHSLELFQARYDGGVLSDVELNQARSEYEAAVANVPTLESAVHQQENALCVLLGRNPMSIPRGKPLSALGMPAIPAGLPADLLERRPDILAAEASLIAANARIGVARALYFPTLSLTGALGSSSSQLRNLFSGPARIWTYGGSIAGPLFTGGQVHGAVRQAEAQHEQLLLNYRKVIQNAFREVDDALIAQQKVEERAAAQSRQVEALRKYLAGAQLVYEGGYSSYIEVLDAERSLFGSELSYAQTQADRRIALIGLYTAMGGGWAMASQMTDQPRKRNGPE
ncbi:MAG TPA: efflux transporter outer membrane subunit [Steroidobacteraceae bacterium]|nr:efflux transporter outer membrane subunit [Steroidobacteraceae bacterium]